jgi:ubiquitin-conjugating enzyme E2 W
MEKTNEAIKSCPDFLEIKPSTIPEMGLGVFAKQRIPANTVLGKYMGEVLTETEYMKRYPSSAVEDWAKAEDTIRFQSEFQTWKKNKRRGPRPHSCAPVAYPMNRKGSYLLLHRKKYIDSEDPNLSNWTRYVNHPPFEKRKNAIFTGQGNIKTIHPVPQGKEIYVHYGTEYFTQINYTPFLLLFQVGHHKDAKEQQKQTDLRNTVDDFHILFLSFRLGLSFDHPFPDQAAQPEQKGNHPEHQDHRLTSFRHLSFFSKSFFLFFIPTKKKIAKGTEKKKNMLKRLAKELHLLNQETEIPELKSITVNQDDLTKWVIAFDPPRDSAFENDALYLLKLEFPETYPMEPPHVVFETCDASHPPPLHEHVYSNGDICLSILADDWAAAIGAKGILLSLISMLSSAKCKARPPNEQAYLTTAQYARNLLWTFHDVTC